MTTSDRLWRTAARALARPAVLAWLQRRAVPA